MRLKNLLMTASLAVVAANGLAFSLVPMSATFTPKGNGSAKSFRVENESSNRVAFQISMQTRDMNEAGEENLKPAGELFTVFPPQGVIAPGQSQTVRVVWKGPGDPTNEIAFRLIAEELPVDFQLEKDKAQIRVLVRYMAALYVRPSNARADLRITSFERTETNTFLMTVTNGGNAHQALVEPELTLIDSQGRARTLAAEQIQSIAGQNILAHHTRRFVVTLPAEFSERAYQAQVKINE